MKQKSPFAAHNLLFIQQFCHKFLSNKLESAHIKDGDGKTVSFTVKGNDVIEFYTSVLGEYYIKLK